MNQAEKKAAAYLRADKIYLHPDSRTTEGFWIACEPVVVTSENDKSLGQQVLQILAKSTEDVPHPESLATSDTWSVMKTLIKAAGVRSYEAFADSTQCVSVKLGAAGVVFTPTRNGGPRKRFLYLKTKLSCAPVEAEVASTLMAAFDACE
jgi:hypothetical protein